MPPLGLLPRASFWSALALRSPSSSATSSLRSVRPFKAGSPLQLLESLPRTRQMKGALLNATPVRKPSGFFSLARPRASTMQESPRTPKRPSRANTPLFSPGSLPLKLGFLPPLSDPGFLALLLGPSWMYGARDAARSASSADCFGPFGAGCDRGPILVPGKRGVDSRFPTQAFRPHGLRPGGLNKHRGTEGRPVEGRGLPESTGFAFERLFSSTQGGCGGALATRGIALLLHLAARSDPVHPKPLSSPNAYPPGQSDGRSIPTGGFSSDRQ